MQHRVSQLSDAFLALLTSMWLYQDENSERRLSFLRQRNGSHRLVPDESLRQWPIYFRLIARDDRSAFLVERLPRLISESLRISGFHDG